MIKLDPKQFRYVPEENGWFARVGPTGVEVSVPGKATSGPDKALVSLLEQTLSDFDDLVKQAERYIRLFIDMKYRDIKSSAYGEALAYGFESNRITVEFTFEDDLYGYWSVTFYRGRDQWFPKAFSREEQ